MSNYPLPDAVKRDLERMTEAEEQAYAHAAQVAFLDDDQIPDDNQFID